MLLDAGLRIRAEVLRCFEEEDYKRLFESQDKEDDDLKDIQDEIIVESDDDDDSDNEDDDESDDNDEGD